MRCANCASDNPEGMKFCTECGAPLKSRCVNCGFENLPQAKFCGECGTSLARQSRVRSPESEVQPSQSPVAYTPKHLAEHIRAEQAAMEARSTVDGERKIITALFADI